MWRPWNGWQGRRSARQSIPNLKLLAVLTSGFNRVFHEAFPFFDPLYSSEYVFLYDISGGTPVFKQAIPIPNAYHGLAWDPVKGNNALYVSGGMGDAPFGTDPIPYTVNGAPATNNGDNVHIITLQPNGSWALAGGTGPGPEGNSVVVSGHPAGNGLPVPNNQFASVNSAVYVAPMAAGVALSNDGQTLVVANYYNDSITVFTGGLNIWLDQWVPDPASPQQFAGDTAGNRTRSASGQGCQWRQRRARRAESIHSGLCSQAKAGLEQQLTCRAFATAKSTWWIWEKACTHGTTGPGCFMQATPVVKARIPVKGQPNKMTLNAAGTLLYVAEDESDTVDVIDLNPRDVGVPSQNQPATVNTVIETIPVIAPPSVMSGSPLAQYTGANTNSVTLSPDEQYLYVTNGNLNNIAVVQADRNQSRRPGHRPDPYRLVSRTR